MALRCLSLSNDVRHNPRRFVGPNVGRMGMGRLTDRSVKTLGEGRHGDGDGLQLIVSASGRRKWVLRYQLNGVRRDMGLGPYPAIGLSDARIPVAVPGLRAI